MTAAEVLRAARERISDRQRWTCEVLARDAEGCPLDDPRSTTACSWCAAGAVFAVTGADPQDTECFPAELYRLASAASERTGRRLFDPAEAVAFLNDTYTHAAVLAVFDAAIAKAEAA